MKSAALALILSLAALAGSLAAAAQQPAAAPQAEAKGPQFAWPERMQNPQVLKADTPPERLREIMRDFAQSLGVRCSHCHVGTEGEPLTSYDFASDANPRKQVARGMVRLVTQLNREFIPPIIAPATPSPTQPLVNCYTCHRGSADPALAPPPAPATGS